MPESAAQKQIENTEPDAQIAGEIGAEPNAEDSFEEYAKNRAGSNQTPLSEWDSPEQAQTDTPPGKDKPTSTDIEADDAENAKGSDDPEKGNTSDDDTTGQADKNDQTKRGEHNPHWVKRRINKAVKKAVNPLNDKIHELESKLSASPPKESNPEDKKQLASDQVGEEPDVNDFDDDPLGYVEALDAWEKSKVEASDGKADEQPDSDKSQEERQETKSKEAHATVMKETVSDIDQILDEKSPDIRDDFWVKTAENKIAFPDQFLDYINDLGDSDKISNLLQHFYHDPVKSRSIARMVGDVEKQKEMFIDLAETPFVALPKESKAKSVSKKAANQPPNIEPVGGGESDEEVDIHDPDISYEQYERARSKQVARESFGGYS